MEKSNQFQSNQPLSKQLQTKTQADINSIQEVQICLIKKRENIQISRKSQQHHKLYVFPVFNNTYLLFCKDMIDNSYLWHFHKDGQIYSQLKTKMSSDVYVMTDREVVFLEYEFNENTYYIVQWNFQTNTVIKCPHKSFNYDGDGKLVIFAETKLIFLIEKTINFDQKRIMIKISSYTFPITAQSKPTHIELKVMSSLSNSFILGKKINENSGVAWVQSISDNQYTNLHIFDMRQTPRFKTYKIDHFFNKKNDLFDAIIVDIWQPLQDELYIKFQILLSDSKVKIKYNNSLDFSKLWYNEPQLRKQQHVYEMVFKNKQQDNQFHVPKYASTEDHYVQFTNGFRALMKYPKPYDLVFNKVNNQIPIYYVNPYEEEIQTKQIQEKYYNQLNKSTTPDYNNKICLDYKIVLENSTRFQITTKKLKSLGHSIKMIASFFLTKLIKDCDEDLLYEVTNIIHKDKYDIYEEN